MILNDWIKLSVIIYKLALTSCKKERCVSFIHAWHVCIDNFSWRSYKMRNWTWSVSLRRLLTRWHVIRSSTPVIRFSETFYMFTSFFCVEWNVKILFFFRANKALRVKVFSDEGKRWNKNVTEVGGEILCISQVRKLSLIVSVAALSWPGLLYNRVCCAVVSVYVVWQPGW